MPTKLLWLTLSVVALFAGLAIGFLLGDRPASTRNADTAAPASPTPAQPQLATVAESPKSSVENATQNNVSLTNALREPNYARRVHDLFEAISKMDAGEISSALSLAQSLPRDERKLVLPILIGHWAESDPVGAASYAINQRDLPGRQAVIDAALSAWMSTDRDAALAWARNLPSGQQRMSALAVMIGALAKRDSAAALDLIGKLPRDRFTQNGYQMIFKEMAATHPESAAGIALALPNGPNRDEAIAQSVVGWAQRDPQGALAWANSISDVNARNNAIGIALRVWAESDPVTASQQILERFPNGRWRDDVLRTLAEQWSKTDPRAAGEYFLQLPAGEIRNNAMSEIALNWADSDLTGALDWVESLPADESTRAARRNAVNRWAESDPRAAAEYFMKTDSEAGQGADGTLARLAGNWARTDPDSALSWARGLDDGVAKNNVMSQIASAIAVYDPPRAGGILGMLPAADQSKSAGPVAWQWAARDAGAAAAWAETLPDGEARTKALRGVSQQWAQSDPTKAAQWLEQLPAGASRDGAVSAFARVLADADPEGAAAWVSTIGDAGVRPKNSNASLVVGSRTIASQRAPGFRPPPLSPTRGNANCSASSDYP